MFALERRPESIEAVLPERTVLMQPGLELLEWFGPEGVEATLSVGTNGHEPGLVEDAQVARHPGLMDSCPLDDVVDLLLASAQHLDDAAPGRIGKSLERI